MANGEDGVKRASREGDAGDVAVAYGKYCESMEDAHVTPRPLKDILGR